jgi:hypothetical protein
LGKHQPAAVSQCLEFSDIERETELALNIFIFFLKRVQFLHHNERTMEALFKTVQYRTVPPTLNPCRITARKARTIALGRYGGRELGWEHAKRARHRTRWLASTLSAVLNVPAIQRSFRSNGALSLSKKMVRSCTDIDAVFWLTLHFQPGLSIRCPAMMASRIFESRILSANVFLVLLVLHLI